jgi:branched-chain amino acid transport system ATP-binding protein
VPSGELLGGKQQMFVLGRALVARPRLLLLDEPSLGLSPLVVADMFNAIRKVSASGITIVLVEQNVAMAMRISHRVCVLELGRIVAEGAPDDLIARPEIRQAYLGV